MRRFIGVFALLLVLHSAHLSAQSTATLSGQYFFNQATFATGLSPRGIAIADVNGDGRADVIVANQSGPSISVLLGQADGTLGPKTDIVLAETPEALVTGDFNADGNIDIAVTQYSGLAVLLGNGDGTFKQPVTYTLANGPFLLAVADLNKDGKPDLVAAGACGNSCGFVSVLLGKGDGTFTAQTDFSPGGVPTSFAVFDLNNDGIPDLAFANSPSSSVGGSTPAFVSVLIANGDGTFKSPVSYTSGADIAGIAAGDVTGDKVPDLVVTHFFGNTVALLKGNGDGTFQAESGISTDTALGSQFIQLVDLNRDGKLDLALSSGVNSGAAVLMGNGDGTFQLPQVYFTGSQPYFFAIGDLNGDGNLDWAMTDWYGNYVAILLGNGDGTFSPRADLPFGSAQTFISAAAIADFDGDGKLDIAAATQSGTIEMLLGNGDGTFKAPIVAGSAPYSNFSQIAACECSKSGHLDLIANGTTLLPGKGDGTFATPVTVNSDFNIRSFAVGDFNGDGNLDILDVGNGFLESQPLQLLLGNGDGTFQAPRRFWNLTGIPDEVAVGDFNHDGKLDLALTVNPNGVAILLGDGAGGFAAPVIYPTDDLPSSITVADLNHDGNLDLVVTGSKVDVFLGKGDGTFPNRVDYTIPNFPAQVATGDFNGDGKLDLAVSGYGNGPGYLNILLGNGDGTFQNPITVTANAPTGAPVLVSDLNGDGVDDALLAARRGSLYLSAPIATVTPSILNFGTVAVGAATPSMPITVTNSGNGPLKVSVPALAAPFSISGSVCQASLPRLNNCTIPVVLNPTSPGGQSGQVRIQENAANSMPAVFLMGTAVVPTLSVNPATLDFGSEAVSVTSSAKTITLANSSSVAIAIASVTASGPFAANSQCGTSLAPQSTCSIAVTFTPSATGTQTGSIVIADNASGSPQSIALTGSGVTAISIAPQTGGSTTTTVVSGSTANYELALTAGSGFSGTVTLGCTGAPAYAVCTVLPSTLTLSSGASGNFSVTVTTSQLVGLNVRPDVFGVVGGSGLLFSALLIPFLRRRSRVLSSIGCMIALAFIFAVSACGGGGTSTHQQTTQNVAPGTYKLTVTASSGNVSSNQVLTLVVQ